MQLGVALLEFWPQAMLGWHGKPNHRVAKEGGRRLWQRSHIVALAAGAAAAALRIFLARKREPRRRLAKSLAAPPLTPSAVPCSSAHHLAALLGLDFRRHLPPLAVPLASLHLHSSAFRRRSCSQSGASVLASLTARFSSRSIGIGLRWLGPLFPPTTRLDPDTLAPIGSSPTSPPQQHQLASIHRPTHTHFNIQRGSHGEYILPLAHPSAGSMPARRC